MLVERARLVADDAMQPPDQRQAAGGGDDRRQGDDRRLRPLARGAHGGGAGGGVAADGGEVERLGDLAGGGGYGVGAGRLGLGALGVHDVLVVGVALDLGGDAVHGLDRFDRIGAGGRLRRQHDGVGALEDGGGDVGDFGAGRHRRGDHRFQHLGGDDHRLAGAAGGAGDLLLDAGHALERHLDAEIAARDHQRVGVLDDLGETLDRLRLLDLGKNAGAAAGDLLDLGEILGALDEGQRDPVDAGVERRPRGRSGPSAVSAREGDQCVSGTLTPLRSDSAVPTSTVRHGARRRAFE